MFLKRFKLIITVIIIMIMNYAVAQDPIVGYWKTVDDCTKRPCFVLEVFDKDGQYYGRVVRILDNSLDSVCVYCTGNKKNQPIVGMILLWNMKKDGDEYVGGKILDPKTGRIYSCKIWRDGKLLRIRNYQSLNYKTQTWHPSNK